MAVNLTLQHLACGYGERRVLSDINLSLNGGEILSLLGPNGVGKTTLFKTLLGFLPPQAGQILINQRARSAWSDKELARLIGYVPQAHTPPFPYRVREVIVMGRCAHLGLLATPSRHDYALAEAALAELGMGHLLHRIYTELSGGEQQMVLIARALTQQPQWLVLDEPTANLDFGNQIRVLEQLVVLAKRGLGIIMTTHDPDHPFLCAAELPASHVALLEPGGRLSCGPAQQILTEENLHRAYRVGIAIHHTAGHRGQPLSLCIPQLGKFPRKGNAI